MPYLIYGAYGYTGALIARAAVEQGLTPTLAGRDDDRLRALADELDLPRRPFSLTSAADIDTALEDMTCVLHCAGPFAHTAAPMVEGCLRTNTHYLDITGEIEVFETLAALDDQAQEMEVMLLPGVGFDVVPSDGLAAHLHRRLPSAEQLELAIFNRGGGISRGTATSAIEHIGRGGLIRRDGKIQQVPLGWRTRTVDFGTGPVEVTAMPWGDVATAYRDPADFNKALAVNRQWTTADGEQGEKTTWFRVTVWRRQAETVSGASASDSSTFTTIAVRASGTWRVAAITFCPR